MGGPAGQHDEDVAHAVPGTEDQDVEEGDVAGGGNARKDRKKGKKQPFAESKRR
jgi:hypothetical protein